MSKKENKTATEESVVEDRIAELEAELEAAKAENEDLQSKVLKPSKSPEGALYLRPNGDRYDQKYVNENFPERVKAVLAAGFVPEADVKKAAKAK